MTGVEQARHVEAVASRPTLSRAWHATLAIVVTAAFVGQFTLLATAKPI